MNPIKNILICVLLLLVTANCKKTLDEYYARPDWLEGPIYQQLQKEGRFNTFIACLDTTGYNDVLSRTGYFTIFAPNDSAFDIYLQDKGISSINQLDTNTIKHIVNYSIVDNGYTKKQLAAFQSSRGWEYGIAFKRITRAGNIFIKDTVDNSQTGGKIVADILYQGEKYIPYFIDEFMLFNNLSGIDYNTFYPNIEYTGFNVCDARVIDEVIIAENGYIYELDKVIYALPNIDQYFIEQSDNYSIFIDMLERLSTTKADSLISLDYGFPVYIKEYSSDLVFAPNDENWFTGGGEPNASQKDGWTLFVPDNASMNEFLNEKLLVHYSSIEEIENEREDILIDFINSHMFDNIIWPSKFAEEKASLGIILNIEDNILSCGMASNGVYYGVNTLIESGNIFHSVFSEIYLNPDYSMMYNAVDILDPSLKNLLTSKEIPFTLLLSDDDAFDAIGFIYSETRQEYINKNNPDDNTANERFRRMFYMHIISGDHDLSSSDGVLLTFGGDILKYDNGQIWGSGNQELNQPVTLSEPITSANNGTLYKLDQVVLPPTLRYVDVLGSPPAGASYSSFYQYLSNSGVLYGSKIEGIEEDQWLTILVPTNEAIAAANLPAYNSTSEGDKAIIKDFVEYHIISNKSILSTGNISGLVNTLLVDSIMGRYKTYEKITINGTTNPITITDGKGNTVNVLNNAGSNISTVDYAILLQIDAILEPE